MKVHIVKAIVFPIVMWGLDRKKAKCWRIDAFKLWCWRRLLRVPWTARRSNQSILKETNPEYSVKGLMLKLKLQYFGHVMQILFHRCLIGKDSDAGKDWRQKEKREAEDEMAGWHHGLDGCESEWTPGAGDGQGGLVCCSSCGLKELDMTERLNWTELIPEWNNPRIILLTWILRRSNQSILKETNPEDSLEGLLLKL